jgi:FKBP-type peptidyl-prolyl cis-trans isomerase
MPDDTGPPTLPPGLDTVRTESGLEYLDVEPGHGAEVRAGSRVTVHYTVWLLEGTLVDSSAARGGPAEFVTGQGAVIPALEEGVRGMRPRGRRRLIAPSDLAYGPTGHGRTVPPYATLIVDLEVLAVS